MLRLSEPHGGTLIDRLVPTEDEAALRAYAAHLPRITLDAQERLALAIVATGAASPLTGFLGHRDYRSVLSSLRLADGTPWPLPFTLAVTLPALAAALRERAAALVTPAGALLCVIDVSDAFVRDPREEATALHGTDDPGHPGVRRLLSRPTGAIGGVVTVLRSRAGDQGSATPRDVRALARRMGWTDLVGLCTAEGLGCIEGTGARGGALLRTGTVPRWHAPRRDALLQALVLKNHGARDVYLEHERSDWNAALSGLEGMELGVRPILMGARAAAPPGLHAATA